MARRNRPREEGFRLLKGHLHKSAVPRAYEIRHDAQRTGEITVRYLKVCRLILTRRRRLRNAYAGHELAYSSVKGLEMPNAVNLRPLQRGSRKGRTGSAEFLGKFKGTLRDTFFC